jgi:hypothetical protein
MLGRSAEDRPAGTAAAAAAAALTVKGQQDAVVRFAAPIFLYEEEDGDCHDDEGLPMVVVESIRHDDDGGTTSQMDVDEGQGDMTNGPDSGKVLSSSSSSSVVAIIDDHDPCARVDPRRFPEAVGAERPSPPDPHLGLEHLCFPFLLLGGPGGGGHHSQQQHQHQHHHFHRSPRQVQEQDRDGVEPAKRYKSDRTLREDWLQHNRGSDGSGVNGDGPSEFPKHDVILPPAAGAGAAPRATSRCPARYHATSASTLPIRQGSPPIAPLQALAPPS